MIEFYSSLFCEFVDSEPLARTATSQNTSGLFEFSNIHGQKFCARGPLDTSLRIRLSSHKAGIELNSLPKNRRAATGCPLSAFRVVSRIEFSFPI